MSRDDGLWIVGAHHVADPLCPVSFFTQKTFYGDVAAIHYNAIVQANFRKSDVYTFSDRDGKEVKQPSLVRSGGLAVLRLMQ